MTLEEMYQECVWHCQQMGGKIAELEDLLFDEPGLSGEELIECVQELLEFKWKYEELCK